MAYKDQYAFAFKMTHGN